MIPLDENELEEIRYGDEYASWLMSNAMNYGFVVCNGDTLLDAQESGIGFEDFLLEHGYYNSND